MKRTMIFVAGVAIGMVSGILGTAIGSAVVVRQQYEKAEMLRSQMHELLNIQRTRAQAGKDIHTGEDE